MLIVFGGLPATGKTTISRVIATRLSATYLRIDVIEQAIRDAVVLGGGADIGPAGYVVANVLAESNLATGQTVVADCVNPVAESRAAWRAVACRAKARLVEVEVICSDSREHRRRAEERTSDIQGLTCPTWQAILKRHYEPWEEPHLTIDTARLNPDEFVLAVERYIRT